MPEVQTAARGSRLRCQSSQNNQHSPECAGPQYRPIVASIPRTAFAAKYWVTRETIARRVGYLSPDHYERPRDCAGIKCENRHHDMIVSVRVPQALGFVCLFALCGYGAANAKTAATP